ncbi:MAG: enoyl-CoA hydratase/isomerase family protein [Cytophagaceae bacterium]
MYEHLLFKEEAGIAVITLNRPEVYNALNEKLCSEIVAALKSVNASNNIKAVVLTGEGKGFCSGLDLLSVDLSKGLDAKNIVDNFFNPIVHALMEVRQPVICRLNGVAAGAGCSLAILCDIILASEEASLSMAFVNIGLVPDTGTSFILPRLVGPRIAFELLTTGRKIDAAEASKIGIVNHVVPSKDLDGLVKKYCDYYRQSAGFAVASIKQILKQSSEETLESMLKIEAEMQGEAAKTEDFKEGIVAFREKRKPLFRGK